MDKEILSFTGMHSKEEIPIDKDRRSMAMKNIAQGIERKTVLYKPARLEILRIQLQYISRFYWLCQGIFVLCMAFVLYRMDRQTEDIRDYIVYASMGAALLGVMGIAELGRHAAYHMAEIEQTCYLNLKQIWILKMLIFGGIDMCVISALIYFVSVRTKYSLFALTMYLLVPFVVSNAGYLIIFSAGRSQGKKYIQITAAAVLTAAAMIPGSYPKAYTEGYLWVWILTLAVSLVVLAGEMVAIAGRMEGGKTICWN